MTRRSSLTSQLYRLARASNTASAASRGAAALGKRLARKRVYRVEGRATRRFLRGLGL